ncbi:MAG: alpha/beta hydrolase [Solirubrobacteraceae bacterium]
MSPRTGVREWVGSLSALRWGEPAGAPRAVLLIHPANLQGRCFAKLVDCLPGGLPCIAPDLRGHGCSSREGPFGVEAWARDCWSVLRQLGPERVCVVGASVGAAIGFELAAAHPETVQSLAGLGAALLPASPDGDPLLAALADGPFDRELKRRLVNEAVAPGVGDALRWQVVDEVSDNDAMVVAAIWRGALATDVRPAAKRWRGPCLLATGEHDRGCPPEHARAVAAEIGCEFRQLPDVGHLPFMEDPEGVGALVGEWIG